MSRRTCKAEQIIGILREAEIRLNQGETFVKFAATLASRIGVTTDGTGSLAARRRAKPLRRRNRSARTPVFAGPFRTRRWTS